MNLRNDGSAKNIIRYFSKKLSIRPNFFRIKKAGLSVAKFLAEEMRLLLPSACFIAMNIFNSRMIRIVSGSLFLTAQVSACTTFTELQHRRDPPKSIEVIAYNPNSVNQDFWYDKSVRAYRHIPKDKKNGHQRLEPIIRDARGKKVQREEELIALSDAQLGKVLGTGVKVATGAGLLVAVGAAIAQVVLFLPCVLVFSVAGGVLGLPSLSISTQLDKTYMRRSSTRLCTRPRAVRRRLI